MEWIKHLLDMVLHLDRYLDGMVKDMGIWIYVLLFLIIFCETGLVVTPILPGDSLLFAVGTLCALQTLNLWVILLSLTIAAILGDSVNYSIGRYFGPKIFKENSRFLNKAHLQKTHDFYERYGGKTIIIARFLPIIRTFAPFVAGMASMSYTRFMTFNVVGGVFWIFSMTLLGYLFGNMPIVKKNFGLVIIAIIIISILPAVIEILRERAKTKSR